MTLANFNSNFNWQLRALQQAADCCGIVPDVPDVPPTPPAVPKSMWVGYLSDTSGSGFANFPTDWILNGDILPNSISVITSPPYSGNGYANQVFDPYDSYCTGCLFRIYTIEDIGFVMPTPWTGTDNWGTPISMSFTEITTKKSFSGTITPGSDTINWIVTGSFSDSLDFPQYVSDPMVSTFLTIIFQRLFGSQASVTVVVNGGGAFTITVSNIYTTDTQIGFYMGDSITYYIPEI